VVIAVKPAPAATAIKAISCVKGKTIKKVVGVAPRCPAGYKKQGK
jgi:hypothetical protein